MTDFSQEKNILLGGTNLNGIFCIREWVEGNKTTKTVFAMSPPLRLCLKAFFYYLPMCIQSRNWVTLWRVSVSAYMPA